MLQHVSAPGEDPLLGCTLHGGYVIRELMAEGSTGSIYRAEQPALRRQVAVKIIHPHLAGDEQIAARFLVEARAASRLSHPNAVTIYAYGNTPAGQPYIVMQLLSGKELSRIAVEEGPLPFPRIVDIVCQVLAALEQAHGESIVHGDVKPENVFVERRRSGGDFVKVFDFGLAQVVAVSAEPVTSEPVGTPAYMSPEVARGEAVDGRSDLWSVGVMLYQLLTGALPFEAETTTQTLLAVLNELPVDPRTRAPRRDIPSELADVTMRALAKKREDRFQSADELANALRASLPSPVSARARSTTPSQATLLCLVCGARNAVGRAFCGECGASLARGQQRGSLPTQATFTPPDMEVDLPFVGRDDDFAWLWAQRAEARAAPLSVRLVGEDGAGKTRLLRVFLDRVRGNAGEVIAIAGEAYEPQLDAIPLTEASLRERIRDACAKSGEVVVAIDDVDRMDRASAAAVAAVFRAPPNVACLFVVTHATSWAHASSWPADRIRELGPLAPDALATLLGRQGWPYGARVRALPLHVDQLLRWRRGGAGEPPSDLGDLVAQRIERLPMLDRRLLLALSAWGKSADPATLHKLVSSDAPLDGVVGSLRRAGFVVIEGGRVQIAHRVLRRVVLGTSPAAVRQEIHRVAFDVLPSDAPLELRAFHASQSDRPFEALVLLEQVAAQRASRGNVEGSLDALRDALGLAREAALHDDLADSGAAVMVFTCKLASALVRHQRHDEATTLLVDALAATNRTSEHSVHLLHELAKAAHAAGRQKEARRHLSEALLVAQQIGMSDVVNALEGLHEAIQAAGGAPDSTPLEVSPETIKEEPLC